MIDIIKIYQRFGIPYQTEGHKHVRSGWIGIPCPFCTGNPGYHLGYCYDRNSKYAGAFHCWRCGGKNLIEVLSSLLNTDTSSTWSIIKEYQIDGTGPIISTKTERKGPTKGRSTCQLPIGTKPIQEIHRQYLQNRNFNPDKIEEIWKIQATGPVGNYKHRIIIPIFFNKKLVSYQGRDITNKSSMKYKACPQDLEAREHKTCLYGLDEVQGDSVVVVEGVTDVWRLGIGAVATFGIEYKHDQIPLLKRFKNIFILFDSEPQAQEQARLLSITLYSPERHIEILELSEGDPGEMNQSDADDLMKELLKN